ncbi:hypothetical protein GCU56_02565 [Geodermatophilus sabuli]|uniref:Uncharacterized protein n=1 Tax=Geodermatophilus sabuli TaxID=1564158 RepID=A0A7K3VYP4_9ACTN|nr:DUF1980 domain-containing protein [Geodermatophilus sabuli]NEK56757.1 hypothetical protein [Geodermatophilus sabuli]
MDRLTHVGLLVLLGAVTVVVSVTDAHLAYVRPGFRPFLLGAGVLLLALGVLGLTRGHATTRSARPAPSAHDHEHGTTPRVAWLLLLPVAVMFLVAPPALGAFTVARRAQCVRASRA